MLLFQSTLVRVYVVRSPPRNRQLCLRADSSQGRHLLGARPAQQTTTTTTTTTTAAASRPVTKLTLSRVQQRFWERHGSAPALACSQSPLQPHLGVGAEACTRQRTSDLKPSVGERLHSAYYTRLRQAVAVVRNWVCVASALLFVYLSTSDQVALAAASLANGMPQDRLALATSTPVPDRYRILWEQALDIITNLHYEPGQHIHAASLTMPSHLPPTRASTIPWGCSLGTRASTYDAIRIRLSELNDPYSRFLEPDEFEAELNPYRRARKLSGVGIIPERSPKGHGTLRVIAVIPESPAEEAGINPGDELVMIDDIVVEPSPLNPIPVTPDEALALLRGPAGTRVRLTVRQTTNSLSYADASLQVASASTAPTSMMRTYTLTRRPLLVAPAVYGLVAAEPTFGYIRLHTFNAEATRIVFEALNAFKNSSDRSAAAGVILDLRNCRGGVFQEALVIASMFIANPDAVLVYTVDSRGIERAHRVRDQWNGWPEAPPAAARTPRTPPETLGSAASARHPLYNGPLVVLVNGASASSSEVLAIALRDHGRAVLLGMPTFGKARIQHYFPLLDGSAIALTVGEFLGPQHERLADHVGLVPQVSCNAAPRNFALLERHMPPDACIAEAAQLLSEEPTGSSATEPVPVGGSVRSAFTSRSRSTETTLLPRIQT
jgi:C-terminal peptidase prc